MSSDLRPPISDFSAGDLLFFRGDDPLSKAIAWETASCSQRVFGPRFSHVAICATLYDCRNPSRGAPRCCLPRRDEIPPQEVVVVESTTLCDLPCAIGRRKVEGVQVHGASERIAAYRGRVWRLRLRAPLGAAEDGRLSGFLRAQLGKPYDWLAASVLAGRLEMVRTPSEDAWFCSELVAAALKRVDRIIPPGVDCESVSPNELYRRALRSGEVGRLERLK